MESVLFGIFDGTPSPGEAGLGGDGDEEAVIGEALKNLEEGNGVAIRDDVEVEDVVLGEELVFVAGLLEVVVQRLLPHLHLGVGARGRGRRGRGRGGCWGHGGGGGWLSAWGMDSRRLTGWVSRK